MASNTCTFTSNISARFAGGGYTLKVTGTGTANIKLKLSWSDNPGVAGDAIDNIKILGETWNSPGDSGSVTNTLNNVGPGDYNINYNGLLNSFKSVSNTSVKMVDDDGNDTNAEFTIENVNNKSFTETVTATLSLSSTNVYGTNCVNRSWATNGATSVTLNGSPAAASGGATVCNGQSNACGGPSPFQNSWTVTATSANGCSVSDTGTVNIYNDTFPTNSFTTSFINLEPNTQYTLNLGNIACTDANTTVSTGELVGNAGVGYSSSREFPPGSQVQLRATSLGFNTDLSGVSSTSEFGKTNTKNVTVNFEGFSITVSMTTRAPRIKEVFDYVDSKDNYPYEDIDLIPNSPTQYIVVPQQTMNDIEIPMEMKLSNPDAQISINSGGWQSVRST